MAACSSSSRFKVRARWPSFKPSSTFFATSSFFTPALSRFASFSRRGMALSSVPMSARISSVLMVSTSELGFTRPSTCTTSGSLKKRTTSQMASVSRMFARNWLPRPSPWLAPATRPAMSTNSTVAGTILAGWSISASFSRRSSGTGTMPTLGSMVAKG